MFFCPKCAAQNAEGAKFCRACGADVSLVPQAVTGQLAERLAAVEGKGVGRRHGKGEPTVVDVVRQIFMGVGFVSVALALARTPMGSNWWFWMLIPGFIFIGGGVGMYLRVRDRQKRLEPPQFAPAATAALDAPPRATELPPARRQTGELVQPPSVTEATTRHLATPVERPTRDA